MALYSYRWDWIFSIPFLWPFFLMIIFQSLSMGAHHSSSVYYKNCTGGKKDEQKSNNGSNQTESTDFDTSKDVSDRRDSAYQKDEKGKFYRKDTKKKECSR